MTNLKTLLIVIANETIVKNHLFTNFNDPNDCEGDIPILRI